MKTTEKSHLIQTPGIQERNFFSSSLISKMMLYKIIPP